MCDVVWLPVFVPVCVCVWESASVDRHFQAIKPKHSINQFDKYTNRSSSAANNVRVSALIEGGGGAGEAVMKLGHNWNEMGTQLEL